MDAVAGIWGRLGLLIAELAVVIRLGPTRIDSARVYDCIEPIQVIRTEGVVAHLRRTVGSSGGPRTLSASWPKGILFHQTDRRWYLFLLSRAQERYAVLTQGRSSQESCCPIRQSDFYTSNEFQKLLELASI